ncbi:nicotinate-nucleotide pyrophosphorylase [carboxylating]-like [Sycon ciliatum]|uniref:nicotinate-nucleotide pyrophosphorylase [carboxylating]-like n=1 Tax=Sycon ciliatum TaxID=27933 RepID=UPI0020AA0B7E|eukprot:scpid66804/ scgid34856/ Nicotinate-nucleotide pyrophosphorylase [carboxylating]; Quinolinate phosphoribosyltransferase [decarboxylating]
MASSELFQNLLTPESLKTLVRGWLAEDTPAFDYGGAIVGNRHEKAVLLVKSSGVLCGKPFVDAIFSELDCKVNWLKNEGEDLVPVCEVAEVTGPARRILLGERVALNCMTRASGVASMARKFASIRSQHGWKGEVVGTRKTTPGFRLVEKYALLVGGMGTHRHDLSSMVMLKDNHIWSAGDISSAVSKARSVCGFAVKIEVECRSLRDAQEAATAGADIVMLDNFSPSVLATAAQQLKGEFPHLLVEGSGGVTLDNVADYFSPHVDVVSTSRPTQGYSTVDFSLKVRKAGHDPSNPTVTDA